MDTPTSPPTSSLTMLPIDQVHDDGDNMRRIKVPEAADMALTASIRRRGVLQPIGVRPNGNGYRIVFGHRRLACAKAAGLAEIPVDIRAWTDNDVRAVQAAENLQRRAPHAIDQWRTVAELLDRGYTIAQAAEELDLDDRLARRMERLGRLDPALLKLAEIEMPTDWALRAIANAPEKVQKAALKGLGTKGGVITLPGGRQGVDWNGIANRCRTERIPQTRAIFDAAAHPALWDEDLFAQPDDPERFSTTDVAKFLKLQQAALEAHVAEAVKAKKRVRPAEVDAAAQRLALPKGWRLVSSSLHGPITAKPKRTECLWVGMLPDGTIMEALAVDVAAEKAAAKEKAGRARDKAAATAPAGRGAEDDDEAAEDAGDAYDDAGEAEPVTAPPAYSKAGMAAIATAKTAALHAELAKVSLPRVMLTMMVLAFAAGNVEVRTGTGFSARDRSRIVARLLGPGGNLLEVSPADLLSIATEMLTQVLKVSGPLDRYGTGSGAAAEWIGAALDAARALPRFDTQEFLGFVQGDELRALAKDIGMKRSGTSGALRTALAGHLPSWRPTAAEFGAPAPEPAPDWAADDDAE